MRSKAPDPLREAGPGTVMSLMAGSFRILALLAAFSLVAAACGGGDGSTTASRAGQEDASSSLSFAATAIDGQEVALADYAGQDVMLWFWAPW